jgi:hypothetical protein
VALEELRTLPPLRPSDRAPVDDFLAAIEGEFRSLQQVAAAASAGNRARLRTLSDKRFDMTNRRIRQAENLVSQLGVTPTNVLQECPVSLPG